jgi:hypothetical protein
MKNIIPLYLALSSALLGSPTAVIELDKEALVDSPYSFEIVRENREGRTRPKTLEIEFTFPSETLLTAEKDLPLRSIKISDQAFFYESRIQVNESLIKEGVFSTRLTVPKSALNDTLITGIYGYGDILVIADLGVLLGHELSSQPAVERERARFRSELVRIIPESEEAIRAIEYLKRDKVEHLLLSHRPAKEGFELMVEGSGLKVEVDPDLRDLEINCSFKGLDRLRLLEFLLLTNDARAVITGNVIKIEPQPDGGINDEAAPSP